MTRPSAEIRLNSRELRQVRSLVGSALNRREKACARNAETGFIAAPGKKDVNTEMVRFWAGLIHRFDAVIETISCPVCGHDMHRADRCFHKDDQDGEHCLCDVETEIDRPHPNFVSSVPSGGVEPPDVGTDV